MAASLIIHAPNVHQGGGRALLCGLLAALAPGQDVRAIIDARLDLPEHLARIPLHRVRPSVTSHFAAEWRLAGWSQRNGQILAFHGLPPLFPCRGKVTVFVQNFNIVGGTDVSSYPRRVRARIAIERILFRTNLKHADELIVQTETMRRVIRERFATKLPIHVRPFISDGPALRAVPSRIPRYDFCYIATGEPHKNHRNLIAAWIELARQGLFPSLCLTLADSESPALCRWIDEQRVQFGLQIINRGSVDSVEADDIYRISRALVFPSRYESLGLPLIEARQRQVPILASDRDYVWESAVPTEFFDPESPRSIARAIQRFLKLTPAPREIATPAEFVNLLTGDSAHTPPALAPYFSGRAVAELSTRAESIPNCAARAG